jgi:hypothetical protein
MRIIRSQWNKIRKQQNSNGKYTKTWRLKNILLNSGSLKKSRRKFKNGDSKNNTKDQ